MNQQKTKKRNKCGDNERVRGNPSRDLPEWLEEFKENLVDNRVPEHRDAPASSSRESSSEPGGKVVSGSGKHSIYTHFPKDKDCEICQRTKISTAPCRKRTGTDVPRAEKIGDLITPSWVHIPLDQRSKNHISLEMARELIAIFQSTFRCPWFVDEFLYNAHTYFVIIFITGFCIGR